MDKFEHFQCLDSFELGSEMWVDDFSSMFHVVG